MAVQCASARRFVCLCIAVITSPQTAVASPEALDGARAEAVVSSYLSARRALRSGMYSLVGYHQQVGRGVAYDETVSGFGAFDYDGSRFRFDRVHTIRSEKAPDKQLVVGGKYARTPTQFLSRPVDRNAVSIRPSTYRLAQGQEDINVRSVGCVNLFELTTDLSLERVNEVYLATDRLIQSVNESGGLWRLSWTVGERRQFKRTIWFDASRGFAPVRFHEFHPIMRGDPLRIVRPAEWTEPSTVSETTWVERSGVWVPESVRIEYRSGVNRPPYSPEPAEVYALRFTWKSINEPVPDELFTADGLVAPDENLRVVDHRYAAPIIVKHPNIKDAQVIRQLNESFAQNLAVLGERPMPSRRIVATIVGSIALLTGALVAYIRMRRTWLR